MPIFALPFVFAVHRCTYWEIRHEVLASPGFQHLIQEKVAWPSPFFQTHVCNNFQAHCVQLWRVLLSNSSVRPCDVLLDYSLVQSVSLSVCFSVSLGLCLCLIHGRVVQLAEYKTLVRNTRRGLTSFPFSTGLPLISTTSKRTRWHRHGDGVGGQLHRCTTQPPFQLPLRWMRRNWCV